MDIASLSTQWPALIVLAGFCLTLLKIIQGIYTEQIRDLRADRDAWRDVANRGTSLAERGAHLAERPLREETR